MINEQISNALEVERHTYNFWKDNAKFLVPKSKLTYPGLSDYFKLINFSDFVLGSIPCALDTSFLKETHSKLIFSISPVPENTGLWAGCYHFSNNLFFTLNCILTGAKPSSLIPAATSGFYVKAQKVGEIVEFMEFAKPFHVKAETIPTPHFGFRA